MKKIIIALIFITVAFSQWTVVNPKPPTEMRMLEIPLAFIHTQAVDTNNVAIPDSFNVEYIANYQMYMYNEDGQRVKSDITQGNLIPYLTQEEQLWLKAFLDKYGQIAIGLLPE